MERVFLDIKTFFLIGPIVSATVDFLFWLFWLRWEQVRESPVFRESFREESLFGEGYEIVKRAEILTSFGGGIRGRIA